MTGKRSPEVQDTTSSETDRQHYATFKVELLLDKDNSVRRTRVTHVQNKSEETWAGWLEPRFVEFVARNAGLHIPLPEPPASPDSESPIDSNPLPETVEPPTRSPKGSAVKRLPDIKIKSELSGELQVSRLEIMQSDPHAPPFSAHANQAFRLCLLLDLSGAKTLPSTSLDCKVTIWAKKLETGLRQIVGEGRSNFIRADQVSCTVEAMIPLPGTYRLEAMVSIMPASTIPSPHSNLRAWLEGGWLQVT